MATSRQECEFFLLRYVPDPVRDEFVHVGVLLREAAGRVESAENGEGSRRDAHGDKFGGRVALKFTSDWRRVRCLDPEADLGMLEGLESELRRRFEEEPEGNLMHVLEDSFSNSVQMTRAKGYLAESMEAGVEELMRMYVESPKRERTSRLSGRAAIQGQMRSEFEQAGVWDFLRKRIEASEYTRPGDPLRIDYGYRTGEVIRMFQAVSLDAGVEMAKVLAFSANGLMAGVQRVDKAWLELTAVVEPLRAGIREQGMGRSNSRFPAGNDRKKSKDHSGEHGKKSLGQSWEPGKKSLGHSWEDGKKSLGQSWEQGKKSNDHSWEDDTEKVAEPHSEFGDEVDSERAQAYRFAVETMEEHRIRVVTTADLGRVAETARRELRV